VTPGLLGAGNLAVFGPLSARGSRGRQRRRRLSSGRGGASGLFHDHGRAAGSSRAPIAEAERGERAGRAIRSLASRAI